MTDEIELPESPEEADKTPRKEPKPRRAAKAPADSEAASEASTEVAPDGAAEPRLIEVIDESAGFDDAPEGGDWPEPEPATSGGAPAQGESHSKKKRRRRKKGGQKDAAQQQQPAASTDGAEEGSPVAQEAKPQEHRQQQNQQHVPHHRVKHDPAELAKMAWKIYLAEVSEEGVALIGDNDARELSRRCFRLAEVFLDEQARHR